MTYKLGSLFDGSGGFPLAGSLCGIEPVWAAEVEPYPIAVTRSRFPGMRHLGDISKVNGAEIAPVDIITFGSPCQDLSTAGKRAGLKHETNGDDETTRSGLFIEAVRIIKEMRAVTNGIYPRYVLWENVPGAFNSNKGEDFRIVLQELIQIKEPAAVMPAVPKNGWAYADNYCGDGWSLAYRVFDAQYWGVPQRRRRIHLVVDFAGQCAQNILFEREGVRGYFAEGGTPWQTAAPDAKRGAGTAETERVIPYTLKIRSGCEGGGKGALVQENQSATLATHNDQYLFQPVFSIQSAGRAGNKKQNGAGVSENIGYTLTAQDRRAVAYSLDEKMGQTYTWENQANTLAARDYKQPQAVCYGVDARNATEYPNLTGAPQADAAHNLNSNNVVRTEYIVRRLTETECGRLQGFADWWADIDPMDNFTPEEFRFWLEVRNTHAAINGKAVKDYTEKQMLTWYNKLPTPSAKYKMWGNGIALPPALYCMQGIVDALTKGGREE